MANSYSHKFGQIIGDLLELAIFPHLENFAKEQGLYLDRKGNRAARPNKKVTWTDNNGNKHDLDFVMERHGTDATIGQPVAFIESAWRRYTKHSKNKAQEIQGAIIPLREKYQTLPPFIGTILAGEFTDGALGQLKSLGFNVLYFPYQSVVDSFAMYGIDANFDEQTEEDEFCVKIESWENSPHKNDIAQHLFIINKASVDEFLFALKKSISRMVEQIMILPLHGQRLSMISVPEAIEFLSGYNEDEARPFPIDHYEIIIRYNTGDKINASFNDKKDAVSFLMDYL